VGRFRPATDGPSTIAGQTDFVIDIRHPDATILNSLAERCRDACLSTASRLGCDARVSERLAVPPRAFDAECVAAVEAAARDLRLRYQILPSGALHDASNIAAVTPTAMIFVPCRDGISHNINEYASKPDLAAGGNVLLRAVLARAGIAE
jgi:beta-ureidopropionase / N-carbamoyl-L-amino-acid hydrolase